MHILACLGATMRVDTDLTLTSFFAIYTLQCYLKTHKAHKLQVYSQEAMPDL